MKKKILISVLVLFICFVLVGCGKTDENNEGNGSTRQDETEINNNQSETPDNTTQSKEADIELYSDDTKIVFKSEQGRDVYYYSGKTITAHHVYIDYGTAANANIALSIVNNEENETIESAHVEGKYLVIVYEKSTYESLNVDTLRLVYSYLEELKK